MECGGYPSVFEAATRSGLEGGEGAREGGGQVFVLPVGVIVLVVCCEAGDG